MACDNYDLMMLQELTGLVLSCHLLVTPEEFYLGKNATDELFSTQILADLVGLAGAACLQSVAAASACGDRANVWVDLLRAWCEPSPHCIQKYSG